MEYICRIGLFLFVLCAFEGMASEEEGVVKNEELVVKEKSPGMIRHNRLRSFVNLKAGLSTEPWTHEDQLNLINKFNEIPGNNCKISDEELRQLNASRQEWLAIMHKALSRFGLKKHSSVNGLEIVSIDLSWPNLQRIAQEVVSREQPPEKAGLVARLRELLARISTIKLKENNRKEMDISEADKEYFLNLLCEPCPALSLTSKELRKLYPSETWGSCDAFFSFREMMWGFGARGTKFVVKFRSLLATLLSNYSGFQRLCSLLVIKLMNQIEERYIDEGAIRVSWGTKDMYIPSTRIMELTDETLKTGVRNYYEGDSTPNGHVTIFHESTHIYHDDAIGNIGPTTDYMWIVVPTIIDSGLTDKFFPMLESKVMTNITEKIEPILPNINYDRKREIIFSLYKRLIINGFGKMLFSKSKMGGLTFASLVEKSRLAKALYINCSVLGEDGGVWKNIFSNPEEMLTILGTVPGFRTGNKLYILEDRQAEEICAVRSVAGESLPEDEVRRKFRAHAADAYKDQSTSLEKELFRLEFPKYSEKSDYVVEEEIKKVKQAPDKADAKSRGIIAAVEGIPGINEMKFPENLKFQEAGDGVEETYTYEGASDNVILRELGISATIFPSAAKVGNVPLMNMLWEKAGDEALKKTMLVFNSPMLKAVENFSFEGARFIFIKAKELECLEDVIELEPIMDKWEYKPDLTILLKAATDTGCLEDVLKKGLGDLVITANNPYWHVQTLRNVARKAGCLLGVLQYKGVEDQKTLLHHAIERNAIDVVKVIVEAAREDGFLIDILKLTDSEGKTPMRYAIDENRARIVKIILDEAKKAGCLHEVLKLTDSGGKTPLRYAIDENKGDVVELIVNAAREARCISDVQGLLGAE